jgi:hypothetical protein
MKTNKPTVEEAVNAIASSFEEKYGSEAKFDFKDAIREMIDIIRYEFQEVIGHSVTNTQEIQEWEDFDEKLPISEWYCSDTKEVEELRETVKSFISKKLKEQEERHKREIKELKDKAWMYDQLCK